MSLKWYSFQKICICRDGRRNLKRERLQSPSDYFSTNVCESFFLSFFFKSILNAFSFLVSQNPHLCVIRIKRNETALWQAGEVVCGPLFVMEAKYLSSHLLHQPQRIIEQRAREINMVFHGLFEEVKNESFPFMCIVSFPFLYLINKDPSLLENPLFGSFPNRCLV